MATMNLDVIEPRELSGDLLADWQGIQQASPALRHPMVSSGFMLSVARHRADVRIGVIGSGGRTVGFFPYQQERNGVGYPVGFRLNDYQAGVFAPEADIDVAWMLRSCGLSSWRFDHLVSAQRCFSAGHFLLEDSPYIDLSQGLDGYIAAIAGRARWKSSTRNQDRLARDVGPVRFEFHTADDAAFNSLLEWKTAQIRQHGKRCVFDWPWVMGALQELRSSADSQCTGVLSTLYAGDQLAAVHFGIRSREVLHWWITTYNQALSSYSPGAVLLVRVIEEAARLGIQHIDLGKGAEPYKEKLQSGATPLASGEVCSTAWGSLFHKTSHVLQERVRSSVLAGPAKSFAYWLEARGNRSS
jgi:CelD/BcsL family acetyltransferase involved in cellulose biosynthesis